MHVSLSGRAENLVKYALTFRVPRAYRTFRGMEWSFVPRSFYFQDLCAFPTGFLNDVLSFLEQHGIQVKVVDQRRRPEAGTPFKLHGVKLKGFQEQAVEKALSLERAVIYGVVSSGKTVIAAAIASRLGLPFLYVTHRQDIARQTYERFKQWFPPNYPLGIITGSVKKHGESIIATYQSLKDLPLEFPVLLVDECHHVVSEVFSRVVCMCDAYYRFGFTGTPRGRSDALDKIMDRLLGPVVQVADYETTRKEGLSCEVKFVLVIIDEEQRFSRPDDFYEAESKFIVGATRRNQLIKLICEGSTRGVTLVIVRRKEHGMMLHQMIPGSLYVDSSSPASVRERARKMTEGVLIATSVIEEGIDNPNIEVLVNAAGGKSPIVTSQRVGRGLRFREGKVLKVVDFVDLAHPLLFKHSHARYKIYSRLGEVVFLNEGGQIVENPFGKRRGQGR